jgi:RimJ/RimL family protein N-acetyltransferase
MSLETRMLNPDDWQLLRELRLAALRDAPEAFCTTYAQALEHDEAHWRAWPRDGAAFVAFLDGAPVGMVGVTAPPQRPGWAELFAMWVAPAARGTGTVGALIDTAGAWAVLRSCTSIELAVMVGNDRATRAYARHGFMQVGVGSGCAEHQLIYMSADLSG